MIELHFENLNELAPAKHYSEAHVQAAWERFHKDMDADKSSFFHLPEKSEWKAEWQKLEAKVRAQAQGKKHFLHLGIGGSSLGAEALLNALKPFHKNPQFYFLDNIDPDWLRALVQDIRPEEALVYVVTKSGTTMETLAQFSFLWDWISKAVGTERAKEHFVFCTDPQKGDLRALGTKWGIPTFSIPSQLGGRFSVLSAVAFVPAILAQANVTELLEGARQARSAVLEKPQQWLDLSRLLLDYFQKDQRNITVLMPYSQRLKVLGAWFVQLWAESLGKNGTGLTPLGAVGATDQHSILQLLRDGPQDKVIGFVEVERFQDQQTLQWKDQSVKLPALELVSGISLSGLLKAELQATRQVMKNNKRPCFTLKLSEINEKSLGALFFYLETCTAVSGYILGIDPFDQPGVEEGKNLTREYLRKS